MKKSDHKEFAQLSKEVFGSEKAYKILLKKGVTYIDKQGGVRVRKYSQEQLRATLIEAVKMKAEATAAKQKAAKKVSEEQEPILKKLAE